MRGILEGKYWCPRVNEVIPLDPPSKALKAEIYKEIEDIIMNREP
jgi:hypothetical protein